MAVANLGDMFKGRELYFVGPEMTVAEAARYMTDRNVGAVCVLDEGRLVGVLSERDMMKRVIALKRDPSQTKVSEVMTPNPVVVAVSETHNNCVKTMQKAGIRHLPVVDGDKLVGLLSLRDLLQVDLDEKIEEIRVMQDYIHYVPPFKPGL
jgi:CBS domain-containing protein